MTLPGTRQAAAWGTGSALRSHRIRDLFGFVTPRIRKGQSSATLRTRSGLFLAPSKGMLQNAESGGTTGCECSDHVRYSNTGRLIPEALAVELWPPLNKTNNSHYGPTIGRCSKL